MKHFKLTNETIINESGIKLFRIELTIDCRWGKKGDKRGFVETEENLSGNAMLYGNAMVFGNAMVSGNAKVFDNAKVSGNARLYGDAQIFGDAMVFGNAEVSGNSSILWISNVVSEFGTLTAYKNKENEISVNRGCFNGTLKEFRESNSMNHGDTNQGLACIKLIDYIEFYFNELHK